MFGYTFKNLPSKYVFAGYSIRKSLTVMTSIEDGKLVYDVFLFTYIDNYLSFYLLMDNGLYKNVSTNEEVPLATAEDLMSKHIARGKVVNKDDYETIDKEKIAGVFGIRNMEELMKQVDEMEKQSDTHDISLEAVLDLKAQYMGIEVIGAINKFNSLLGYPKDMITIPAISLGPDDSFKSLIGDEVDFFDFMSNKDSDTIVRELKKLADSLDGIGNVKEGKVVTITKGDNGEGSKLEVTDKTSE